MSKEESLAQIHHLQISSRAEEEGCSKRLLKKARQEEEEAARQLLELENQPIEVESEHSSSEKKGDQTSWRLSRRSIR